MKSKFKDEVYTMIKDDVKLRIKIARVRGTTDASVYALARRKSESLTQFPTVQAIVEYTGKKANDLFAKPVKV